MPADPKRGFLLMPFLADFDWLRKTIVSAGKAAGVTVKRADDIFTPGVVIEQIKDAILNADVVVAVCTGKNANVFYELGIAEHLHRPVLIAETETDLPFDVKHFRALLYGGKSRAEFRRDLRGLSRRR
jgi:hypothetical protein